MIFDHKYEPYLLETKISLFTMKIVVCLLFTLSKAQI